MKIRVFKNENKELYYEVPGAGDGQFMMLAIIFSGYSKKEIKQMFGPTMPELDIECELNPNDDYDCDYLESIELVKKNRKVYGVK